MIPPAPGPDALSAAAARNDARVRAAHAELYRQAFSYQQAADQLDTTSDAITTLIYHGELITIDGPDGPRIPAWQIHDGQALPVREIAAEFPGGVLGFSSWVTTPKPELAGRTPIEAITAGDADLVVAAARAR